MKTISTAMEATNALDCESDGILALFGHSLRSRAAIASVRSGMITSGHMATTPLASAR